MTIKRNNFKNSALAIIMFLAFVGINSAIPIVYAQTNPIQEYTLLEPLPCIPNKSIDSQGKIITDCTAGTQIKSVKFEAYMQYMFNLAIAIAAVLAVLMIVTGGFQYMSSDSFKNKNDGLTRAKNALFGLLLVLSSYLILRTIDPKLVEIDVGGLKPLNVKPSSWSQYYSSILPELTRMTKAKITENNALLNENKKYLDEIAKLRQDRIDWCFAMGIRDEEDCYLSNDPAIRSALLQEIQYQNLVQSNTARIDRNIFDNEILVETTVAAGPVTDPSSMVRAVSRLDGLYKNAVSTNPEAVNDLRVSNDNAKLALIKKYSEVATVSAGLVTVSDLVGFRDHLPDDPQKREQAITYINTAVASAIDRQGQNDEIRTQLEAFSFQ